MMARIPLWASSQLGGLPRAFWLLWTGTVITRLGSFILPFLQIYLTSQRGLTVEEAALLLSLYGLGSLVANPLGGVLADRIGRKPTMLLSLVLAATTMFLLGLARNLSELTVAMAMFGLVNDIYRPASMAVISDVVPAKDRLRAFTYLYWAFNLGAAIAPLVAGFLAKEHFPVLFTADAATTLILATIIAFSIPETRPARSAAEVDQPLWRGLLVPFRDRAFVPYLGTSFLLAMLFFQFLVAMPADMKAHGLTEAQFGTAIAFNGLMIIVVQPWVVNRVSTSNRARVLALSSVLVGAGYGLNALARQTFGLWVVGVALWTAGELLMAPVNSSIVADLSPTEHRGRYQGAYAMAWSLAWMIAPLFGGVGISKLGSAGFWGLCFGVGGVVAVLQWVIAPARRRRVLALHGVAAVD